MSYLVAIDGSDESEHALEHALTVAEAMDATVTVVNAVDPAAFETGGSEPITTLSEASSRIVLEDVERAERRGQDALDEAVAFAAARGHQVEAELLYGPPVRAITDFAEETGADAVFVGHRGRSERTDLMVGSVAKGVVERSTVPVTVVR